MRAVITCLMGDHKALSIPVDAWFLVGFALQSSFKCALGRFFQAGRVVSQMQVSVGVNRQSGVLKRDISK